KKASNAAKPPADAPMPTIGNSAFGRTPKSASAADSASTGGLTGLPGSAFSSDGGSCFMLGFFLVTSFLLRDKSAPTSTISTLSALSLMVGLPWWTTPGKSRLDVFASIAQRQSTG